MRRLLRNFPLTFAVLVSLAIAGCHSSSVQVTAPSTSKCQLSATTSLSNVPAAGGSGTVAIDTTRDCAWSASTAATWITFASSTSGLGSGTLDFRVGANPVPAPRKSLLSINDTVLTIDQGAATCTFAVSPINPTAAAAGGSVTVQVTTTNGCAWTSSSNTPWLTVAGGANASGPATITVARNTGTARTGTVTIAGQMSTVSQAAAAAPTCTFMISPTSQTVSAVGGSVTVQVTTTNGCAWTSSSNTPWLTVAGGASTSGSATITVAANIGAARSGTVAIAGQTFTASQDAAGSCSYSISPTTQSMPASAGSVSVRVTTTSGCAWTATSGAAWIAVTGGGTGRGNGTVDIAVSENTGNSRSGTATVAGNTLTIAQSAPCTFSISPTSRRFGSAAATGAVTVTTQEGCTWTASTSDPDWLSITSGKTGTGNGTVAYAVEANRKKKDRTGQLTIGGKSFDVTQNGNNDSSDGPEADQHAAQSESFSPTVLLFVSSTPFGDVRDSP